MGFSSLHTHEPHAARYNDHTGLKAGIALQYVRTLSSQSTEQSHIQFRTVLPSVPPTLYWSLLSYLVCYLWRGHENCKGRVKLSLLFESLVAKDSRLTQSPGCKNTFWNPNYPGQKLKQRQLFLSSTRSRGYLRINILSKKPPRISKSKIPRH
jgi:hypothetical protein